MDSESDNEQTPFTSQGEWTENKEEPKSVLSNKENFDKLGLVKVDIS